MISPERIEKLVFNMEFDKKKYEELKEFVHRFKEISFKINDGDTLTIAYDVSILYFEVSDKLRALLEIAKRYGSEVISISTEELNYGECLIQEVLLTFQKIKETLNGK